MLDVAVVGLGWWGNVLADSVAQSTQLRVVRGVDPREQARHAFTVKTSLPAGDSLEECLQDRSVQAVILATPHALHVQQIVAAARAGKHVFCEKPLALTRADMLEAIAACERAGVLLGVGHERRFEPPMLELQRLVNTGRLGRILQIEANQSHDKFDTIDPTSWRLSAEHAPAGGMTANGIHLLDLAVSMLGDADHVLAESRQLATALPTGDSLATLVSFSSGATAYISAMLATPFIARFAVYGQGGWIEVRDKAHVEAPQGWWLTRCFKGGKPEVVDYPAATPVRTNLEAFADAIAGGPAYPISTAQMLATASALEAILLSAKSGKIERVTN